MIDIVQSKDSEVGTFVCPSCKAIWRAKGEFEQFLGGWHYNNEDYCPHGCKIFLFFRVRGDEVGDNRVDLGQRFKSFITSR